TLVELLIVIVVIAILAAIILVAYNGIQTRALDAQRQAKVQHIAGWLTMFYQEHGAYPSHSEVTGQAGATLFQTPIESLSPPEYSRGGIIMGFVNNSIDNPSPSDYRFTYITHPNSNGSGFSCSNNTRCQSFDLGYIMADGTAKRITNPESLRASWSAP
ncbi:MAG: hypothetical protein L0H38_01580, partial [bacterium]|nr:hypothetical protein [bacterium]